MSGGGGSSMGDSPSVRQKKVTKVAFMYLLFFQLNSNDLFYDGMCSGALKGSINVREE